MAGQTDPAAPREPRRVAAFTFGLDRIGLLALKAPWLSLVVILLLTALAAWSVTRIKVDDSLSELFRTNTAEFRQYEEIDRRFPSSEYDVLVVVEGANLLEEAAARGLPAGDRRPATWPTASAASSRCCRRAASRMPSGYAPPIVPDTLPDGDAYNDVIKRLADNEVVDGKFLSADGTLALGVIALDREAVEEIGLKKVIDGIKAAAEKELKPAGPRRCN